MAELEQQVCLGWEKMVQDEPVQCFLIYQSQRVYSYKNRCPHTGVNLDWNPDQFLDSRAQFIQCSLHGALFEIESGHCIYGPCVGDRLTAVQNEIVDGQIYLFL